MTGILLSFAKQTILILCVFVSFQPNKSVSVDGKSSDPTVLSSLLDEVKTFLTEA